MEIKEYAARFTTDIISLTAFGIDTDSLNQPDAEFRIFGRKLFEPTFRDLVVGACQNMMPKLYTFFRVRNFKFFPKQIYKFFLTDEDN